MPMTENERAFAESAARNQINNRAQVIAYAIAEAVEDTCGDDVLQMVESDMLALAVRAATAEQEQP